MKHILYTLTMPTVGSWNGKFTGDRKLYCVCRAYPKKSDVPKKVLSGHYFNYNFGDGWRASIECKEIIPSEKRYALKNSSGFMGYEWMIDEIEKYGRIKTLEERDEGGENERESLCK